MLTKLQGALAEKLFHGFSNNQIVKLVYGESSELFSKIITGGVPAGEYKLLDIGSHKGEFLNDLILKLPKYKFDTTAVELNESDLNQNTANHKILSDVKTIPLFDKEFDITISRYVLAWNLLENQKKIISEIKRLTKGIAIIQHQGADKNNPKELQESSLVLFSGVVLPLKRDEFYFSTETEIENILKEENIKYEIVQSRKVNGLAELLIEKYSLSDEDASKTREILKDSNYVVQSTFVLDFRNN